MEKYNFYLREFEKVDAEQQQWRNETNNDYYQFYYEFVYRINGFAIYFNKNSCFDGININCQFEIENSKEIILIKYLRNMKKEIRRLKKYGSEILLEEYIPKLRKAKNLERKLNNKLSEKKQKEKVNKI